MSELPIGTVHHGAKMAENKKDKHWSQKYRDNEIDAKYVNNKMESLMAALFDTIGENEERIKDLELQVFELTKKIG
tara:strand:- start:815 stop:1042 length:228 start_codon:yes stop_codon:yes gene_type:complete